ncbi:MAG: hypothetical protein IKZ88_06210 [Neisseriaceae bacterium]|nr:hypothetical protein [Neisseriaceae bacterium]
MSQNDKRELFEQFGLNTYDETEEGSRERANFYPKYSAEFGYYHERFFISLLGALSSSPHIAKNLMMNYLPTKDEYQCLLQMKEDLEQRINTAIDKIDNLISLNKEQNQPVDKLEEIKNCLWQTGENRWLEVLWDIERVSKELKELNEQKEIEFKKEFFTPFALRNAEKINNKE